MAAFSVAGAVVPTRASSIRPSQPAPRFVARSAFSGAFKRHINLSQSTRIRAGEASAGTTAGMSEYLLRMKSWATGVSLYLYNLLLRTSFIDSGAGAVNDNTWEELVLKSPVPVLVDFWAPWCGPCRMIAPIIDELSQEYGDKIRAVRSRLLSCLFDYFMLFAFCYSKKSACLPPSENIIHLSHALIILLFAGETEH